MPILQKQMYGDSVIWTSFTRGTEAKPFISIYLGPKA